MRGGAMLDTARTMTDSLPLAARFQALTPDQKRRVHFDLAASALAAWQTYLSSSPDLFYVEGVVGTRQAVDEALPEDAFQSARAGKDLFDVAQRYLEPITAMHDDDLVFPEPVTYAYYALYNLFRRYAQGATIDDWLLVNQALSSEPDPARWSALLATAVERAGAV